MLHLKTYLVKERVAVLKLTDAFDIYDAEGGGHIGQAREEIPGWSKALRLLIDKRMLPTTLSVYDADERLVFRIRRGISLLRTKVTVHDADDRPIGYFKSKLLTIGGGFFVYEADDRLFAEVKGDWKGWNFQIQTTEGRLLGTVSKQWAGLGKELFTSADNYVIALGDGAEDRELGNLLLLAAGLAIDTVYKESG